MPDTGRNSWRTGLLSRLSTPEPGFRTLAGADRLAAALGPELPGVAMSTNDLHELGPLLGTDVVRRGRTVFKSVGVAVQDWAIARLLADRLLSR